MLAPLVIQLLSVGLIWRADLMRISCTSRQPRLGLASSMRAVMPETNGVAADVPPKEWVYVLLIWVLVIPCEPPLEGADTTIADPGSE